MNSEPPYRYFIVFLCASDIPAPNFHTLREDIRPRHTGPTLGYHSIGSAPTTETCTREPRVAVLLCSRFLVVQLLREQFSTEQSTVSWFRRAAHRREVTTTEGWPVTGRIQVDNNTAGGAGVTTLLDSTLELRCAQYRREFHLPASIDPTSRHILLEIGPRYGAITMPADLGERVQQRLAHVDRTGPVVHHPRARRWTFITGPARPDMPTTAVSAELFRLYATVACTGSQVVLPSAKDERTGYRIWIQPPETASTVPPLEIVIEATRAAGVRKARNH
jgi:hypothetical protein